MRLKIDVGEPRNFDAGGGSKTVTGTLIEPLCGSRTINNPSVATLIQSPGGAGEKKAETVTEYWFVVNFAAPVVSGEISFSSLLLTPRYKVKKPPIEYFKADEDLVINAIWRQDGKEWDEGSIKAAREGGIEVEGLMVARVSRVPD